MQFLDGGGPCGTAGDLANPAVHSLIEEAARLGAGSVELRSTVEIDIPVPALKDKVNLVRPLPGDAGELWGRERRVLLISESLPMALMFERIEAALAILNGMQAP